MKVNKCFNHSVSILHLLVWKEEEISLLFWAFGAWASLNFTFAFMGGEENQSPILGFWGLCQKVFPFSSIHLNGCLRNPIYPLLRPFYVFDVISAIRANMPIPPLSKSRLMCGVCFRQVYLRISAKRCPFRDSGKVNVRCFKVITWSGSAWMLNREEIIQGKVNVQSTLSSSVTTRRMNHVLFHHSGTHLVVQHYSATCYCTTNCSHRRCFWLLSAQTAV